MNIKGIASKRNGTDCVNGINGTALGKFEKAKTFEKQNECENDESVFFF